MERVNQDMPQHTYFMPRWGVWEIQLGKFSVKTAAIFMTHIVNMASSCHHGGHRRTSPSTTCTLVCSTCMLCKCSLLSTTFLATSSCNRSFLPRTSIIFTACNPFHKDRALRLFTILLLSGIQIRMAGRPLQRIPAQGKGMGSCRLVLGSMEEKVKSMLTAEEGMTPSETKSQARSEKTSNRLLGHSRKKAEKFQGGENEVQNRNCRGIELVRDELVSNRFRLKTKHKCRQTQSTTRRSNKTESVQKEVH